MIRKTFTGGIKGYDDKEQVIIHSITSLTVDRDGEVIIPKGAKIENFRKNPVVLFAHDYKSPPIGKNISLEIKDDEIIAKTQFADTQLGRELYQLYKEGFMSAWSVGFIPVKESDKKVLEGQKGKTYEEWELLEYSAVPVPSNPEALTIARSKGLKVEEIEKYLEVKNEMELKGVVSYKNSSDTSDDEIKLKGVIPYKETPKAPEDYSWNAPKEIREADVSDLKIMCAWYDSENPDIKTSYKLPHHRAKDHYVVWRGVAAAMGALLGARGGVNIPEKDKRGVYNHLAKHYKQFDKEPPEFKEYTELELKGLAYEGLIILNDDIIKEDEKINDDIVDKEGRVLSEKNRKLIKEVITRMDELKSALEELYNASEPKKDSPTLVGKNEEVIEILQNLNNLLKEVE